uniref:Putative ovule protein n=1 Tax=Solanum chacoense TaxID=4108 RepID=A0A0V0H3U6_SOLCH
MEVSSSKPLAFAVGIGLLGQARHTGLVYCSLPLLCGLRAIAYERNSACAHPKSSGCGLSLISKERSFVFKSTLEHTILLFPFVWFQLK